MKNMHCGAAAGVAIIAGLAAGANADTITGRFTYEHLQSVNITTPVSTGSVNTVKFNWTRQDVPAAGVDTRLETVFNTACIEPSQGVSPGVNNIFDVVTPEAHGFTPLQTTMLQRLFADYYPAINSGDTSAAFQLSVWEIVFDTSVDLSAGLFRSNAVTAAVTTATGWLSAVSSQNYSRSTALPELVVLQSATVQDQIAVVPAPASATLACAGMLVLGVRRRRA